MQITHHNVCMYNYSAQFNSDLLKLPFADSISVEDDSVRLEPSALVEVDEHLSHHDGQLCDDLLTMVLDTDCGRVATWVGIHTRHQLEEEGRGRHFLKLFSYYNSLSWEK